MFIRTENGIYDTNELEQRTVGLRVSTENGMLRTYIKRHNAILHCEKILKQADTIIELCDGLIDTDTHFPKVTSDNLWDIDELENLQINYEVWNENEKGRYNVYGFIQTEKGLIYVAKMNEKGELELL